MERATGVPHHSSAAVPSPATPRLGMEERLERQLVVACLAGMVAWPLVYALSPAVVPLAGFHIAALIGALVASVPLPIMVHALVAVLRRGRRALWVVDPAWEQSTVTHLAPVDALERVKTRAQALGLMAQREETHGETRRLFFGRPRIASAATFLDHGFDCEASFIPGDGGTTMTVRVQFLDTLLVDNSEGERLKELADHLLLLRPDFQTRSTMLTLHGGCHLAVLSSVLAVLALVFPVPAELVGSVAAAGAMVLAADLMVGRAVRALGVRAALAGMVLCGLPWLAEGVRLVRHM